MTKEADYRHLYGARTHFIGKGHTSKFVCILFLFKYLFRKVRSYERRHTYTHSSTHIAAHTQQRLLNQQNIIGLFIFMKIFICSKIHANRNMGFIYLYCVQLSSDLNEWTHACTLLHTKHNGCSVCALLSEFLFYYSPILK